MESAKDFILSLCKKEPEERMDFKEKNTIRKKRLGKHKENE